MSEENSFGSILTTARRRMGWNQQELADKLRVSRTTVNRWEQDIQHPPPKRIEQLIAMLGLNEKEADALSRASGQPTFRIRSLPLRNQLFTGREGQLELIGQLLKENSSVALIGLAGIGKTQLALEYAHCSYPDVYRAVFWVDAADSTMLLASYDNIARKLGLLEQDERDQDLRIRAVKGWLEDHTNWLLIMDNADDLSLARSFFPSAHDGHILLTTRTQIVGKVARKIEVEKMEPEEGQLFLLRRSDTSKVKATLNDFATDTREAALRIAELLDGLPLALDQAGAYIEGGVSLTDYIDHYHEQRRCLLKDRGPLDDDHPESVVVTFDLCFDKARAQHPLASDILCFCSFLQPDAIPDELFKCDDSFRLDKIALKKGKEALLRYSMMKHNAQEKTFSIHRLVQAVLIDGMASDLQQLWRERVVRALNAAFPEVAPFPEILDENWGQCERLLSHALACSTWTKYELTPTVGVAELFTKTGIYLRAVEQDAEAETLLAHALSIYEQNLEAEPLDTASALYDLAGLYYDHGKYEQAEPLVRQALVIREKHLGAEHLDTVRNLYNLANLCMLQGKDEQAGLLFQRAFRIKEKHILDEYPDAHYSDPALPLLELAHDMQRQRQHKLADELYQRILSIRERKLGKTHLFTQRTRADYAAFLRSIERDAEADALVANDDLPVSPWNASF